MRLLACKLGSVGVCASSGVFGVRYWDARGKVGLLVQLSTSSPDFSLPYTTYLPVSFVLLWSV